jgi:putative ABC transport system permease protein
LTLAGAMFVAVFSTRESLNVQINQVERYIAFDALLRLPGGRIKSTVEREALRIDGVSVAEGWGSVVGVIVRADDTESAEFEIVGLPFETSTIDPLLNEGVWLQGEGLNQIVVNEDLLDEEPDIRVDDKIVLEVDGKQRPFEVVGIASKHLSGSRIYMDYGDFERLSGRNNLVDELRVIAAPHMISSPSTQDGIAEELEDRFTNAKLNPGSTSTRHAYFGNITDTFDIILIVLIVMAVLLAIVGGLGLMGTLGINVLERTREIGVLRAVGASNLSVRQVVVIEGVVVGLLSWILGGILSGPSSWALAGAVINTTLETGLRLRYSFLGLFIWLVIVLLIGVFSSLAPARGATRLRVRDVLDYE